MQPPILYNLFSDLKRLKGVGPKMAEAYGRLGCYNMKDLIFHWPSAIIDRRYSPPLNQVANGSLITHTVSVDKHVPPPVRNRRIPYKIECSNDTGALNLVYFNAKSDYLLRTYEIGKQVVVSGKVEHNNNILQMVHPDIVAPVHQIDNVRRVEPVYPLTYGMTNRFVSMAIQNALGYAPELPEWISTSTIEKYGWKPWLESLKTAHAPQSLDDVIMNSKAKERLAYDELLAQQISLQLARTKVKRPTKEPINCDGKLVAKLLKELPFELTNDQKSVISEITTDQKSNTRMMRLLQGDVGSGKTMVAFCAMLNAVEGGKQAALMVPTEILSRQHYANLKAYCDLIGIRIGLLINNIKASERKETLEGLASGEIDLVVGTHALFQETVEFKDLSLVIIDEQHRFGVEQRMALVGKGNETDFLMMSATPIPRTLSMVGFGDMDVSVIREKPANRLPIDTTIMSSNKIIDIIEGVKRAVDNGEKIFWLCPLIEESEAMDLTDVNKRFESIEKVLPGQVGMVHGRMKSDEREAIMQDFVDDKLKVLIATTVIEVGVDVPDATIMVIENSERFGLSQLHQLRGRVGRGDKKSHCILVYKYPISKVGIQRLQVIKDSHDGFYIAEQDLILRGSGDVLGTKQSGLPSFRVCDLFLHAHLVQDANKEARKILDNDPTLSDEANKNIRLLLHLFEYDKQMEYLSFS